MPLPNRRDRKLPNHSIFPPQYFHLGLKQSTQIVKQLSHNNRSNVDRQASPLHLPICRWRGGRCVRGTSFFISIDRRALTMALDSGHVPIGRSQDPSVSPRTRKIQQRITHGLLDNFKVGPQLPVVITTQACWTASRRLSRMKGKYLSPPSLNAHVQRLPPLLAPLFRRQPLRLYNALCLHHQLLPSLPWYRGANPHGGAKARDQVRGQR